MTIINELSFWGIVLGEHDRVSWNVYRSATPLLNDLRQAVDVCELYKDVA